MSLNLLIGEKIKKLQESASHTGKQPKIRPAGGTAAVTSGGVMEFSTEEQLKQLERRLKSAIKAEEYEEAAVCRDRIKALKEENEKNDEMV